MRAAPATRRDGAPRAIRLTIYRGWWKRFAFDNPFDFNSCVPLAIAHALRWNAVACVALAGIMSTRHRDPAEDDISLSRYPDTRLYAPENGTAFIGEPANTARWSEVAGFKIMRQIDYEGPDGPSCSEFARATPRGVWLVLCDTRYGRHMVAVVGGLLYGYYGPRDRVYAAFRIERV